MTSETMIGNLDLNMKKRVPKKPKMRPPYNKTQEQERKAICSGQDGDPAELDEAERIEHAHVHPGFAPILAMVAPLGPATQSFVEMGKP
jgi:hypothetical protein